MSPSELLLKQPAGKARLLPRNCIDGPARISQRRLRYGWRQHADRIDMPCAIGDMRESGARFCRRWHGIARPCSYRTCCPVTSRASPALTADARFGASRGTVAVFGFQIVPSVGQESRASELPLARACPSVPKPSAMMRSPCPESRLNYRTHAVPIGASPGTPSARCRLYTTRTTVGTDLKDPPTAADRSLKQLEFGLRPRDCVTTPSAAAVLDRRCAVTCNVQGRPADRFIRDCFRGGRSLFSRMTAEASRGAETGR